MTQVLSLLFPTATPLALAAGADAATADPEAVFAALMAEGPSGHSTEGDLADPAALYPEGGPPSALPQPVRAMPLAEVPLPDPGALPFPAALPAAPPIGFDSLDLPRDTPLSAETETQSDAPLAAAPEVPAPLGVPPLIAALPGGSPAAQANPDPAKLRFESLSAGAETTRQIAPPDPAQPGLSALAVPAKAASPEVPATPRAAALPVPSLAAPSDGTAVPSVPMPPALAADNPAAGPGPVALTAIPVPQRETDALVPIEVLPRAEASPKPQDPVPPPGQPDAAHHRNTAPDRPEAPAPRALRAQTVAVGAGDRPAPSGPQPPPAALAVGSDPADPAPKSGLPTAGALPDTTPILPEQSLVAPRQPEDRPLAVAPGHLSPKDGANPAPDVAPAPDAAVAAGSRLSGEEGLLRAIWLADPEPVAAPALPALTTPLGTAPSPPVIPAPPKVVAPLADESPRDRAVGQDTVARPVTAAPPSSAPAVPTPDQAPVLPAEPVLILDLQPRNALAAKVELTSSAPPSAPPGPPPVSLQVAQAVTASGASVTELTLNPEELGRVRIDLHSDGDRLTMVVSAERPETLDLLRRHSDQLVQDLRGSGHQGLDLSFSRWTGQGGDQRALPQPPAALDDATPFHPPDRTDRPAAQPVPAPSSGLYLRI
jgi:flagellar hook-length control protein FliK